MIGGQRVDHLDARDVDDHEASAARRDLVHQPLHDLLTAPRVDHADDRHRDHVLPELQDRGRELHDRLLLTLDDDQLLIELGQRRLLVLGLSGRQRGSIFGQDPLGILLFDRARVGDRHRGEPRCAGQEGQLFLAKGLARELVGDRHHADRLIHQLDRDAGEAFAQLLGSPGPAVIEHVRGHELGAAFGHRPSPERLAPVGDEQLAVGEAFALADLQRARDGVDQQGRVLSAIEEAAGQRAERVGDRRAIGQAQHRERASHQLDELHALVEAIEARGDRVVSHVQDMPRFCRNSLARRSKLLGWAMTKMHCASPLARQVSSSALRSTPKLT